LKCSSERREFQNRPAPGGDLSGVLALLLGGCATGLGPKAI